jgi:hypothetical protein
MTTAAGEATWSRTKMGALRECHRKFYFLNHDETPLKKMKNRYLWSGSLVHDAIGDLLKSVRQEAEIPSDESIIETVRTKMRDEFKNSKTGEGPRLFEHEYNLPVNSSIWKNQWDGVERSLRWFLSSKWLARLKALGPESWKTVDELLHVDVDGIKAFLKMDCAIEAGGRFVLIDWKTSALKPGDEFPLLVSALYAHDVWGADADSIDAYAVSLHDGRQMKASINEESLMETFLRIQEEASVLKQALDEHAGLSWAQIPMTSDLHLCDRCNFRRTCHAV